MSPFITVTIYQGNVRYSIRTYYLRDMPHETHAPIEDQALMDTHSTVVDLLN